MVTSAWNSGSSALQATTGRLAMAPTGVSSGRCLSAIASSRSVRVAMPKPCSPLTNTQSTRLSRMRRVASSIAQSSATMTASPSNASPILVSMSSPRSDAPLGAVSASAVRLASESTKWAAKRPFDSTALRNAGPGITQSSVSSIAS